MAIAFVNSFKTQRTTSALTLTVSTSSIVAGNLLIVGVVMDTGSISTKVADDVGTAFGLYRRQTLTNNVCVDMWIGVAAGASTTVTVTTNISFTFTAVVAQYSGAFQVRRTTTNTGSSNTSATLSITTGNANNFVVAVFGNILTGSWSASVGNLRDSIAATGTPSFFYGFGLVDNTAASPGSVTCTATISTTNNWAGDGVELTSLFTGWASAAQSGQTQPVMFLKDIVAY